ncbi:ROK family protein [Luethyella okanaganae]|uniref:ROK family protein n=1 Tax=Luethyella okanaganae TaxID=69372 RepID=A0ABW1VBV7_9MICO
MPKATISTLVAELEARGLVRDGHVERDGAIGRPAQVVELDGRTICALGAEVSPTGIGVIAEDLQGEVLFRRNVAIDVPALTPAQTLDQLARVLRQAFRRMRNRDVDVVGACVAVPGMVDVNAGMLVFSANIGWRDVDVIGQLQKHLGEHVPPLQLENNVRVGAVAEHARVAGQGEQDLVYLIGEVGIGAGIIVKGQLLRGHAGHAGEVGHMALGPPTSRCPCGRRGCWELTIGLRAFLELAADPDDPVRDPSRHIEERLGELRTRAEDGDQRVVEAFGRTAKSLADGIAIITDLLDPSLIVLGGYFAFFGDHYLGLVQAGLDARAMTPTPPSNRVVASTFGYSSALRGAAAQALRIVYQDPTLVPMP